MTREEAMKVLKLNRDKHSSSINVALDTLLPELNEETLTDFEEEVQTEMWLYKGRKQRGEIFDENSYIKCAAGRLLAHARVELERMKEERK